MSHRKIQSDDDVFALIVAAAVAGERCPQAKPQGPIVDRSATMRLARDGKIRVDIYFRNYRVATIMEGKHRGKETAPCPKAGAKPYRTVQRHTPVHGYRAPANRGKRP